MATLTIEPKATRRERWAWYLYDFGNSAYAAVVLLAVYSAYYKGAVVGGAEGSRLWGIGTGIAMLLVALTAPILGTIADYSGAKKRVLAFYTALAVLFCGMLFFVQEGNWFIGLLFFVIAETGYRSAQVFYNSLLPEIAHPEEMPRVSGNGWAVGSLGGVLCLIIVLVPIVLTKSNPLAIRLSLVFTAVYYAVAALPSLLWIKESHEVKPLPEGENYLSLAFKRLGETFRAVKNYREFIKFMISYLIYNDGILMVMGFAGILGHTLFGMEQQELIIFMIIVQITSVVGAYLFGLYAGDFGGRQSLIVALLLMVVPVVWLYFTHSKLAFYFIGGLAGFALTGVQSVSRTLVGLFTPQGRNAEFYGFFAMAGRTSSFIGPVIFGQVVFWATRRFEGQGIDAILAEQMGHRVALFTIIAFLVIGFVLLLSVNENKARAASGNGEAAAAE
jgi:UMF1 family MFS transporter